MKHHEESECLQPIQQKEKLSTTSHETFIGKKKKHIDFPDFTGRRLYNGKKIYILPAHDRTGRASVLHYHLAPEKKKKTG